MAHRDDSLISSETAPADRSTLAVAGALDPWPSDFHSNEGSLAYLERLVEEVRHFLPAQGPISVFIHHNTLHAFEHLQFDEGVQQGARLFGCQPYLSEDRYRDYFRCGRIRRDDLAAELLADLGDAADELLGFLGTRFHLRMAMLEHPLRLAPTAELRWFMLETDALYRFRPEAPPHLRRQSVEATRRWLQSLMSNDSSRASGNRRDNSFEESARHLAASCDSASPEIWCEATANAFTLKLLWRVCRDGVHGLIAGPAPVPPCRHRDWLRQATGCDSDELVHDLLIRFTAAFLDQGLASWKLPGRERGFLRAFIALYSQPVGPPDAWLRGLAAELRRIDKAGLSPLEAIEESLDLLGVRRAEWKDFLSATLLALRGFAGMISQLEKRGDRAASPAPAGSLVEFLAVRLLLDRFALRFIARQHFGSDIPLSELRGGGLKRGHDRAKPGLEQHAFLVFQLAQVRGWSPLDLRGLSRDAWAALVRELDAFSGLERRRIFHGAFERRYRIQTLDALAGHSAPPHGPPAFQLVCCLDEREESFRRHLEEVAPQAESFGAAGFFSVAMYYRGGAETHFVPLCPIVVRPRHWVAEEPAAAESTAHHRRTNARRALGALARHLHFGSRGFTSGALLSAAFGPISTAPLVARVLFPRLAARIRRSADLLFRPPAGTIVEIERSADPPGPIPGHRGFTLEEMAELLERQLRDIGLTRGFARLVLILGHGSSSLNNPHNSAYNCGACGGNAGGPNAQVFCRIANDARVRERLRDRGILIPTATIFVPGCHNTCDDEVTWFGKEQIPPSHQEDFAAARDAIAEACLRNAHERCRRFVSAPLEMSVSTAKRHVEARSEDLAQVRPECGHASNAVAVIGRRRRTRGLFMDRRAFLVSYDPTQDDGERSILLRILNAVVPVCAGINLEYFFSYVDSTGYGCGTKLPHNVVSLLGVMDGAASDLRTGLPWQMVEIHEPLRLLMIVETTPKDMEEILDRLPAVGQLCRNGWVQLATLDPHSNQVHLFQRGRFEPYTPEVAHLPSVASSIDWYRGRRENLPYALIGSPPGCNHA